VNSVQIQEGENRAKFGHEQIVENGVLAGIRPVGGGAEAGRSWAITFFTRREYSGVVYKSAVIPQPLTGGGGRSCPDTGFFHCGG
jgi:hypothetical protein